jgi:large subunit ribosomal protein L35
MKSKKALEKRFKVTRTGKVLRRPVGQDHYLAKKPGEKKRQLRKWVEVPKSEAKKIKKIIG